MRLTARGRYALRMMLEFARHENEAKPVSLAVVAENTGISRGFLDQVATSLRKAHLLRSIFGRSGGYRLSRPASEITLGQVTQAAIGPICIVDCVTHPELCERSDSCPTRLVYALVNHRIIEALHEYTLADLVDHQAVGALRRTVDQLPPIMECASDPSGSPGERGTSNVH